MASMSSFFFSIILQLACVDEGLASCWVHIDGRPRRKDERTFTKDVIGGGFYLVSLCL